MTALNQTQEEIVSKAREIAEGVIATHAADVDRKSRFPNEAIQALGEAGLLGLTVPAEYGGMGQGMRTTVTIRTASALVELRSTW